MFQRQVGLRVLLFFALVGGLFFSGENIARTTVPSKSIIGHSVLYNTAFASSGSVKSGVENGAKDVGHSIKRGVKRAGRAIKGGVKSVGHSIKRGGKTVGHSVKRGAKGVGHFFRNIFK